MNPSTQSPHTRNDCRPTAAACPEIHICVRRTIDWQDEAAVEAELKDSFRPKMEIWNTVFKTPYHRFRQRLKEIAEINLSRVRDATVSEFEHVPPRAIVVPVDDDDWFSPELAQHLREAYDPALQGYYWTRYVLEARPGIPLPWPFGGRGGATRQADHSRFTCGTNNYAFVRTPDCGDLLGSHARASRYFDQRPADVRRLPRLLSIQNRNLSSQTVLGWKNPTISIRRLHRRYRRYRKLYTAAALPPALAWARPYVDMMSKLMDELRVGR